MPSDLLKKIKKTLRTFALVVNKTHSALSFSQCYTKQKINLACPKKPQKRENTVFLAVTLVLK